MTLLARLRRTHRASLSPQMYACLVAACQEANVREAPFLSQSYCALTLLRQHGSACVTLSPQLHACGPAAQLPRDQLSAEIARRLPPVKRDASGVFAPLQFDRQLVMFMEKHGSVAEPATMLRLLLGYPDDVLRAAIIATQANVGRAM